MKNEIWEKVLTFLMDLRCSEMQRKSRIDLESCVEEKKAGDITKRIYKDRGSAFRKRQDGTTRICRTIKTGVI